MSIQLNIYGPGFDSVSNVSKYQEYIFGDKGGRCVGLNILTSPCADCLEIWEPQSTGTLRAFLALYRGCCASCYQTPAYSKLKGYEDNNARNMWTSCGYTNCTCLSCCVICTLCRSDSEAKPCGGECDMYSTW